jgi:hypothetical protein
MLYKLNVSHQLTGENVERVVLLTAVVQPFICSKSLYSTEGAIKMKQVTTQNQTKTVPPDGRNRHLWTFLKKY